MVNQDLAIPVVRNIRALAPMILFYLVDAVKGAYRSGKRQAGAGPTFPGSRGADVLLHDAEYRDHEYGAHIGWGHSSIGDTIEFASKSGVEKVVLFHHDPYHTDDDLEELLKEAARQMDRRRSQVQLAVRGHDDRLRPEQHERLRPRHGPDMRPR